MMTLAEKDQRYIWHPFTQMKEWMDEDPIIIESGNGAILRDTHGNEYIDANSSIWTNLHGHCHPKITQAIKTQLDTIAHSSFLGLSNVPAIQLAEKLINLVKQLPSNNASSPQLTRVFYSDDGSTAMEAAIKMAYQYWQHQNQHARKKFVTFADAYHGDTIGAVSISGIKLFHSIYQPLTFDSIRVGDLSVLERLMEDHQNEVAAVCIEPLIQGAGGMKLWQRGLLAKLRLLCDRFNVLLIADEVMTGFGRTGTMFACEQEAVIPDIMAVAKGLTGGYLPLAATLVTDEIFDAFLGEYSEFKTFFHGHSYTGNQLGCAAALANLTVFEEEQTLGKLKPKIHQLHAGLESIKALPHVGNVRCLGFISALDLLKDVPTHEPFLLTDRVGTKVCIELRKRGVLTRPLGNTVMLMPPYCITSEQLDQILNALSEAIKVVIKDINS